MAHSLLDHDTQLYLRSQLLCSKVKNTLIYSSGTTEAAKVFLLLAEVHVSQLIC